jgi:hypothetical protein
MRHYASEQGVTMDRVGVYRYEEGAEHFKQSEWDALKSYPTFEEIEAYIAGLGQVFIIGFYVKPE